MANKKANTIKRFVENLSKEVADAAYNGGGGGSSDGFLVIPANSIITVDFNKMLNLLIEKRFDVDVEIPSTAAGYRSGVQFGNFSTDPFNPYPAEGEDSFRTNDIVINKEWGAETYYASIDMMGFETIKVDVTTPTTIKQMLTAAGIRTSATPSQTPFYVIPFISAKNGSTDVYTIYKLTAEEYKSFVIVTPAENNSSTPSTGGEPDPLGPILPINPGQ